MNGFRRAALLLSFFMLPLAGCAVGPIDDEAVGTAENAFLFPNALTPDALTLGALTPSVLTLGALTPDALDPSTLVAIDDPGEAGTLSRQFIEYAVGCAFTTSQSFSFTWTDSSGAVHDVTDVGGVGLAPEWATGPLNITGQNLVSACLAARTNYYGVTVIISMRSGTSPLDTMTPRAELAAYPDVEGAFWGNLFAPTPELYSCFDPANVANDYAEQRECAVGHVESDGQVVPCGPIVLTGPCDRSCGELSPAGQYYPWCHGGPPGPSTSMITDVITTGLP
jgi:hypothetical protein